MRVYPFPSPLSARRRRRAAPPTMSAPTRAPAPPPASAYVPPPSSSYPSSGAPAFQGATTMEAPRWVEDPQILPPDEQLVAQDRDRDREPALSPFGRAALGAAIGGLATAAFQLPGGAVGGALAGGVIGYFLPMARPGRGGRRG